MEGLRCHEPRRESGHARYAVGGLHPIRAKSEDKGPVGRIANENYTAGNASIGTGRTKATSRPSIYPGRSSAPRTRHRSSRQAAAIWPCPKKLSWKQPAPPFGSYWTTSLSKSSIVGRQYRRFVPHNGSKEFKRHKVNNTPNKHEIFTN